MGVTIREMQSGDLDLVLELWKVSEGIGLSSADSPPALARYLERNPGLSFVACEGKDIVGALLCGHDGRRGYIHHLAVRSDFRRRSLGRDLVARSLKALQFLEIQKCHLFVFEANKNALTFWQEIGWS